MCLKIIGVSLLVFTVSCSLIRESVIDYTADISSSLEEISEHKNKKAEIARKLPKKIGNMELHEVVDFGKRYFGDLDMGYGFYYKLKQNTEGFANIYLFKEFKRAVKDGLDEDNLIELLEGNDYFEQGAIESSEYQTVYFQKMPFYQIHLVTRPDKDRKQRECYLFITGYNEIYVKTIFDYPKNKLYSEAETNEFMKDLVRAIKK